MSADSPDEENPPKRITTMELVDDAHDLKLKTLKAQNSLYRKGIIFIGGLSTGLVVAVAGMTYWIVNASKDTVIEGRTLLTKGLEPVGVNENEIQISLGSLAYMPKEVPAKVSRITLEDEEGRLYYRTTKSIDVTPKKSFLLQTMEGDTVAWDLGAALYIKIALADGVTSWETSSRCVTCTATSVVADEAINQALKDFDEDARKACKLMAAQDPPSRKLQGWGGLSNTFNLGNGNPFNPDIGNSFDPLPLAPVMAPLGPAPEPLVPVPAPLTKWPTPPPVPAPAPSTIIPTDGLCRFCPDW